MSLWDIGELRQYDISDPFRPRPANVVKLDGTYRKAAHPSGAELNGALMISVSEDRRRIYTTQRRRLRRVGRPPRLTCIG